MKEITIEESKQIQLELLSKIHDFCEENQLTYYLAWGTLLGAVRHKGFIPWDDDIDIILPRDDYEIFRAIFKADNAKFIDCYNESKYYLTIGKVIDTRTILKEKTTQNFDIGVYVDVFVLDGLSSWERKNQRAIRKLLLLRDLLALNIATDSNKRKGIRKLLYKMARPFAFLINNNYVSKKMDGIAKSINKYENAEEVAALLSPDAHSTKYLRFNKSDFDDKILMPFEDKCFWGPKHYDTILRRRYGEYMKLPPIEAQVSHHSYVQFWK